ncbi:hypothetical protein AQI88_36200 [Streptomyces cellostaticus]|uniref:Uncharacterized protein n=1 Tax=Streptomyces cellostaticus TaxID=67285 RepID=A0A101NE46_9ACTN|nr:hypothetical protein AQI88_36200 [Streptomyces cellostaticus]
MPAMAQLLYLCGGFPLPCLYLCVSFSLRRLYLCAGFSLRRLAFRARLPLAFGLFGLDALFFQLVVQTKPEDGLFRPQSPLGLGSG